MTSVTDHGTKTSARASHWAWRALLYLLFPLAFGALVGTLFWGDPDLPTSEQSVAVILFPAALVIFGLLSTHAARTITGLETVWVFFLTHAALIILFTAGAFAPFALGIGELELRDIETPTFECCGENAQDNFIGLFATYAWLTAIASLLFTPLGVAAYLVCTAARRHAR